MKYWSIGMFTILLIIGFIILLFCHIEIGILVSLSLIAAGGAYPLGRKVSEFIKDVIKELKE